MKQVILRKRKSQTRRNGIVKFISGGVTYNTRGGVQANNNTSQRKIKVTLIIQKTVRSDIRQSTIDEESSNRVR